MIFTNDIVLTKMSYQLFSNSNKRLTNHHCIQCIYTHVCESSCRLFKNLLNSWCNMHYNKVHDRIGTTQKVEFEIGHLYHYFYLWLPQNHPIFLTSLNLDRPLFLLLHVRHIIQSWQVNMKQLMDQPMKEHPYLYSSGTRSGSVGYFEFSNILA